MSIDAGWNRGFTGRDYLGGMHWTAGGKGERAVRWMPELPEAGVYEVFMWYGADNNNDRATNARFVVKHRDGETEFRVNLKKDTGGWKRLGEFAYDAGRGATVTLTNDADGTRWKPPGPC